MLRMKPSLGRLVVHGMASAAFCTTSSVATLQEVDGCSHSSDCIDSYWRTIWFIIGLAVFAYLCMCAWTCCISNRVRKKFCYLCEDMVPKHQWSNGSHRRKCQKLRINREFLAKLPTPYASVCCPDCSEKLKLWPATRGPQYFTCDGDTCIYEGYELKNTGNSRYNCFLHDFNLCKSCVDRALKWKIHVKAASVLRNSLHNKNKPAQQPQQQPPQPPQQPLPPPRSVKSSAIIQKVTVDNEATKKAKPKSIRSTVEGGPPTTTADIEATTADIESAADNNGSAKATELNQNSTAALKTAEISEVKIELTNCENSEKAPNSDKWSRSNSFAHAIDT